MIKGSFTKQRNQTSRQKIDHVQQRASLNGEEEGRGESEARSWAQPRNTEQHLLGRGVTGGRGKVEGRQRGVERE
jgi:hypothetical protein